MNVVQRGWAEKDLSHSQGPTKEGDAGGRDAIVAQGNVGNETTTPNLPTSTKNLPAKIP